MGENSRINWIDTAKGIGIVLVVIGHTSFVPKAIIDWIFTFHMPLFFFLSGYVFREKAKFYVIQIKQLLIKYIILSLTFSISYCYLSGWRYPDYIHALSCSEWEASDPATPLWFLLSLFFVKCIYNMIYKCKYRDYICIILAGFGFALSSLGVPIRAFNASLIGILFFALGNLERERNVLPCRNSRKALCAIAVSLGLVIITSMVNGRIDMNAGQYNSILLFIIGSFAGIVFVIITGKIVTRCQILAILGRNSLTVYLLHMYTVVIMQCIEMRAGLLIDTKIKIINKLLNFVIMGIVIIISEIKKRRLVK